MTDEVLLVEKQDYVCTLTINRPDRRNALNPEVLLNMGDTLKSLEDAEDVRVVIIRGAGDKAFSSGMDIGGGGPGLRTERDGKPINPLSYGQQSILGYPFPTIAMVYGYAMGAGLDIAVACDLRVAAETAQFAMVPTRLGRVYHYDAIQRFINLVGLSQTKELFFAAKTIDAARAREIGLVDHVVPAEELPQFTYGLAKTIAANGPLAVKGTKAIINKLLECQTPTEEAVAEMMAWVRLADNSEDIKEGQRAFAEKRPPRFVGR